MKSKQLGLSPVGVLAMTCLFALAVIIGLKLTTHYIDYFSLKGIYERLLEDPAIEEWDEGVFMSKVNSRAYMSGMRDYKAEKTTYMGEDNTGKVVVEFNYEVREHILGNIDVILTFSYSSDPDAIIDEEVISEEG